MFNLEDVYYIANKLGISFKEFTAYELLEGINIELEHSLVNKNTNVTDNDLETTTKIALAHLNEFPNYYNKEYGLKMFEEFLKNKSHKF